MLSLIRRLADQEDLVLYILKIEVRLKKPKNEQMVWSLMADEFVWIFQSPKEHILPLLEFMLGDRLAHPEEEEPTIDMGTEIVVIDTIDEMIIAVTTVEMTTVVETTGEEVHRQTIDAVHQALTETALHIAVDINSGECSSASPFGLSVLGMYMMIIMIVAKALLICPRDCPCPTVHFQLIPFSVVNCHETHFFSNWPFCTFKGF